MKRVLFILLVLQSILCAETLLLRDNTKFPKSGGTITGNVDVSTITINNLLDKDEGLNLQYKKFNTLNTGKFFNADSINTFEVDLTSDTKDDNYYYFYNHKFYSNYNMSSSSDTPFTIYNFISRAIYDSTGTVNDVVDMFVNYNDIMNGDDISTYYGLDNSSIFKNKLINACYPLWNGSFVYNKYGNSGFDSTDYKQLLNFLYFFSFNYDNNASISDLGMVQNKIEDISVKGKGNNFDIENFSSYSNWYEFTGSGTRTITNYSEFKTDGQSDNLSINNYKILDLNVLQNVSVKDSFYVLKSDLSSYNIRIDGNTDMDNVSVSQINFDDGTIMTSTSTFKNIFGMIYCPVGISTTTINVNKNINFVNLEPLGDFNNDIYLFEVNTSSFKVVNKNLTTGVSVYWEIK